MNKQSTNNFWFSSRGVVAVTGIGFMLYFLVIEHGEHIFPYLPFIILLLCPLMHVFMHSGHGDSHHGDHTEPSGDQYRRGYEDGLKGKKSKEDTDHA